MDKPVPKILVVFANFDRTHRMMLDGILEYVRSECTPAWQVQLELRDISRSISSETVAGDFSGIIAAVFNASDRRKYFRTGLPTVLFEPTLDRMDPARRPANNITFFNDHAAEGRTAAEYFLERGYRSFAFVGTPVPAPWSVARGRGFAARLAKAGFATAVYPEPAGAAGSDFTLETPILARWLKRLPRTTAILAAHDQRAQQVETAARRAAVRIPDHIALLGVDDDTLLCETASPPISSIPVYAQETGRRLAEAMHALLMGKGSAHVVRTCHTRVVTRLSTDAFALDDPVVSKALAWAQSHLADRPGVGTLARAANCSVRTLEMKFAHTLNRTVRDELAYLKRREAVKLLKETSLPVAEISRLCGYCGPSHLGLCLKRATGMTPRALRKSAAL